MVGYACGALGPPGGRHSSLHLAILGGSRSDCSNTCAGPSELRFKLNFVTLGTSRVVFSWQIYELSSVAH
jgi:hypothetical protein